MPVGAYKYTSTYMTMNLNHAEHCQASRPCFLQSYRSHQLKMSIELSEKWSALIRHCFRSHVSHIACESSVPLA